MACKLVYVLKIHVHVLKIPFTKGNAQYAKYEVVRRAGIQNFDVSVCRFVEAL